MPAEASAERWKLPEATLPNGDEDAWYAVDGVLTRRDPGDTEMLPGSFVAPGLVDAHVHLFLRDLKPADLGDAKAALRLACAQGVLLLRDMGAPGSLSLQLPDDPELPEVIVCGRQLAVAGGFIDGSYDPVEPARLVDAALEEVAKGATWVKVLTDWATPDLTYPLATLRQMVRTVHDAGARVAAHSQWTGVREVILTGVDSIEHGYSLDEQALEVMAERGIGWAPTAGFLEGDLRSVEEFLERPPDDVTPERMKRARDEVHPRVVKLLENVRRLVPVAVRLGVPVLASTDNAGTLAEDVRRLARYGLNPVEALRTATTDARAFLGRPSLDEGAAADVVTFDRDPRTDLSILDTPAAVLVRGRRVRGAAGAR